MAKRPVPKYDFKAFGAAIKAAREGRKESRKKVGDEMFISPRYLANIENKGQHPSLQIFFELIQRYHISVDQFLLDTPTAKDTKRRQLDALLEDIPFTFRQRGKVSLCKLHSGDNGVVVAYFAAVKRPGNVQGKFCVLHKGELPG